MDGFTVTLQGSDALKHELAAFSRSIGSSITRASLHRAVEPVKQVAKSMYPVGSGPAVRSDGSPRPRLKDTIAKRTLQYRNGDGFYSVIGPRGRSDGKRGSEAPHAHLIERGTVKRYRQVINGKYYWVMFTSEWKALGLSGQRAATPQIQNIRPHITHPVTGLYQKFYNARWAALSAAASDNKRRTGQLRELRVMPQAWQSCSDRVISEFARLMDQKIRDKATRMATTEVI